MIDDRRSIAHGEPMNAVRRTEGHQAGTVAGAEGLVTGCGGCFGIIVFEDRLAPWTQFDGADPVVDKNDIIGLGSLELI